MSERKPWSTAAVAPARQARVLHEALPYVQSVQGKTFVVLCEGELLADPKLRTGLARDIALLNLVGLRLVIVTGGSTAGPAALFRSSRDLVGCIGQQGCRAVALTVEDGGRSGLAGGLIQRLHARRFIAVVMPLEHRAAGCLATVDADRLAGELATGLGSEKLLILGDAPGVRGRDGRLVVDLRAHDLAAWPDDGTLPAATRSRLGVALDAVARGVRSAHLVDGRGGHALLLEVLSNAGEGTMVLPEQAPDFLADSQRYLGP